MLEQLDCKTTALIGVNKQHTMTAALPAVLQKLPYCTVKSKVIGLLCCFSRIILVILIHFMLQINALRKMKKLYFSKSMINGFLNVFYLPCFGNCLNFVLYTLFSIYFNPCYVFAFVNNRYPVKRIYSPPAGND